MRERFTPVTLSPPKPPYPGTCTSCVSDRVSEWVSEENCNLGKSSGALQEGVESEKATTSLRCWLVYAGMEMEGWSGKEGVICYRYGFFHFEMPPLSFPFHF